jgi:hypothetical protein
VRQLTLIAARATVGSVADEIEVFVRREVAIVVETVTEFDAALEDGNLRVVTVGSCAIVATAMPVPVPVDTGGANFSGRLADIPRLRPKLNPSAGGAERAGPVLRAFSGAEVPVELFQAEVLRRATVRVAFALGAVVGRCRHTDSYGVAP